MMTIIVSFFAIVIILRVIVFFRAVIETLNIKKIDEEWEKNFSIENDRMRELKRQKEK